MDDNTNQPPPQQIQTPEPSSPPEPETQSPQPSVFENNKVIYFVLSLLVLIIIIGFVMFSVLNNLRSKMDTPRRASAPAQITTPTIIASPSAEITPSPSTTPLPTNPNNAKRKSDLIQLQFALQKFLKERGSYPPEITTTTQAIARDGANLCQALTSGYIQALPKDPLTEEDPATATGSVKDCNAFYITGYTIGKDSQNKVTIKAPYAEEETISITF